MGRIGNRAEFVILRGYNTRHFARLFQVFPEAR